MVEFQEPLFISQKGKCADWEFGCDRGKEISYRVGPRKGLAAEGRSSVPAKQINRSTEKAKLITYPPADIITESYWAVLQALPKEENVMIFLKWISYIKSVILSLVYFSSKNMIQENIE